MIYNRGALLRAAPIADMVPTKVREHGVSYGLGEAGYDIRIKQDIVFDATRAEPMVTVDGARYPTTGRFVLASAIEQFQMPTNLVAVVHDKSTWARRALSVFNTVIEPGWHGYLTLELVYNGTDRLHIPAGSGIAQCLFHHVAEHAQYEGKYQDQEDRPQEAKFT